MLSPSVPLGLRAVIGCHSVEPASPETRALSEALVAHHGNSAQAILLYGSCFRTGEYRRGIVDLYVLVDRYGSAYRTRTHALLNTVLPPNVFYLELPFEGSLIRAKYAVLTLDDFRRGTSRHWFHSYLWARFAQPAALLYASSPQVADDVQAARSEAVITFITRVLPRLPPQFDARELWQLGLSLSYRAELRAERPESVRELIDAAPAYYEHAARAAMAAVPFPVSVVSGASPARYHACITGWRRAGSRLEWAVRRWQGKLLSVLRLLKGLLTFERGLDYVLWKIERHSGAAVDASPRSHRHPLLAGLGMCWRWSLGGRPRPTSRRREVAPSLESSCDGDDGGARH
jgi:hypothetical protein